MRKDTNLHEACCPQFDQLPENVACFAPDICAKLKQLKCQHRRAFTRRRRLHRLALPKRRIRRYIPRCPCQFKKDIEIIHLEEPMHTRTEQLAYPPVRKLLLFKTIAEDILPQQRVEIVNRLLRKSLLSLYSRLENVQPPQKPVPIPKWDKNDWKVHTKYLKNLAVPKTPPVIPPVPVKSMPLARLNRFKKLAKPKKREELEKEPWVLTPEQKNYKPTPRTAKLAEPKQFDEEALYQSLPIKVSPGALQYKATSRIKELATAAERRAGESDLKENPFVISPNALKAKPTARITELAVPKEFEETHIRENPNAISPAALKAKASPRIIELAKPKGSV